jgi:hypothetical protein
MHIFSAIILLFVSDFEYSVAAGGDWSNARTNDSQYRGTWKDEDVLLFNTQEYKREATSAFIDEVNKVVQALHLREVRPIVASNLIEVFVSPPVMRGGSISTSNYAYYFRLDGKFSGMDQRNLSSIWPRERIEFLWPMERMDTNGVFQDAVQRLSAIGIDVKALNSDCSVDIIPTLPEGPKGKYFVPDYWVTWRKGGHTVAFVCFFAPSKTIRSLQVYDPTYNLRKPIEIKDLRAVLRRGNAPAVLFDTLGLQQTNIVTNVHRSAELPK